MKYYQIVVDAHYIPPVPVGWYGKIDQKTVAEKKSYEMPLHLLFEMGSAEGGAVSFARDRRLHGRRSCAISKCGGS